MMDKMEVKRKDANKKEIKPNEKKDENENDDEKEVEKETDEDLDIITITLGKAKIFIFETLKGLVREKRRVREAFEETMPEVVALPISKEQLEGLKSYIAGKREKVFLSHYEEIYARNLAKYGKVMVPPPSYIEAAKICKEKNIDIVAADMNEEEYTDAFIQNIRTYQYLLYSIRWRLLKRKRFKSRTPRDFVFEWDREISKIKGFANLERARERYIASEIIKLATKYNRVLAIVELERSDGISSEILEHKSAMKGKKNDKKKDCK